MKTIHLTDAELAMVRNAMHGYLTSFGHNEADVVEQVKTILRKLSHGTEEAPDEPELIG